MFLGVPRQKKAGRAVRCIPDEKSGDAASITHTKSGK